MGGISLWQLGIILMIVLLLFGTKRLRGLGGDLGNAIKGFRNAMQSDDDTKQYRSADEESGEPATQGTDEKPAAAAAKPPPADTKPGKR